jgi:5-methylcytosine-specific restriction endonuclease McrA
MPSMTLTCFVCNLPMQKTRTSKPQGSAAHRACSMDHRPEVRACRDCGVDYPWSKDSRCNPCRYARLKANAKAECAKCDRPATSKGLCSNHYSQAHRAKHGRVYPDGQFRRPARECAICKKPVTRVFESSETAMHKKCRIEFPGKARRVNNGKVSLARKSAEARLAKAAKGVRGNRVFVAGGCSWCGTYFVGTGAAASYCSDKCRTSATFRKRSSGKTFKISPKKRFEVYERDGWTCQLCDHAVSPHEHYLSDFAASLDHIIPQSRQLVPDHSVSNLRLVHRWCNSSRGDGSNMSDEEFRRRVRVKFSEVVLAA